jgi:Putative transposase/Transposase zinc-binding domain
MIRLASVIRRFESAFLDQYRDRLRPEHTHALAAMKHCRSQASPKMLAACTECAHQTLVPHSCGHRHCPHCQHHESQQWIERQLARQVPAQYFLITFTLPAELRALARAHPRSLYDLMLRCAWETVRTFSHNDRQLRGIPGAIGVLHTNTRAHEFHPHVHLVMPAAAIDAQHRQWRTKARPKSKAAYLFNHTALAKVFRAKMLAGIAEVGLALPERYPHDWVVDCKCVGSGKPALIYLGRYLYRGVIREQDILAYDHDHVCFRYRDAKTGQLQSRTVAGAHFLWLILQHVLPKRFRRARNFGFLHPNCKRLIALLHLLLRFNPGPSPGLLIKPRAPIRCACCGAVMTIVRTMIRCATSAPLAVPIPTPGAC